MTHVGAGAGCWGLQPHCALRPVGAQTVSSKGLARLGADVWPSVCAEILIELLNPGGTSHESLNYNSDS